MLYSAALPSTAQEHNPTELLRAQVFCAAPPVTFVRLRIATQNYFGHPHRSSKPHLSLGLWSPSFLITAEPVPLLPPLPHNNGGEAKKWRERDEGNEEEEEEK